MDLMLFTILNTINVAPKAHTAQSSAPPSLPSPGIDSSGDTLRIGSGGAAPLSFDLHRLAPDPPRRDMLSAGAKKVPEDPETLRRRAAWFQRRSGGSG